MAFQKAAEAGAGWIETDIQMLADGTLAVFHDLVLGRTAEGSARVVDLTWKDLSPAGCGQLEVTGICWPAAPENVRPAGLADSILRQAQH